MMSECTLMWGLTHQEKTNPQRDVVETGFIAVPLLFRLYLFQSLIWMQSLENSCSRHELPVRSSILGTSWTLSPNLGTLSNCLAFLGDIKMSLEDIKLVCSPLSRTLQPRLASNLRSSGLPPPEFWDCCCAPLQPLTLSLILLRFYIVCMNVSFACMYMYLIHIWCPWRTEEC